MGNERLNKYNHFYPRPPRGGRLVKFHGCLCSESFLSTPSARRATSCTSRLFTVWLYFYPRPPRGGRQCVRGVYTALVVISIHALREEGDVGPFRFTASKSDFYPRPPRGGRRKRFKMSASNCPFLSTPSARRATTTRPETGNPEKISIHALREEGDLLSQDINAMTRGFLSTPSARRATADQTGFIQHQGISIHALREEGDPSINGASRFSSLFLSTPSARRATVESSRWSVRREIFLSTPSARRATGYPKLLPSSYRHFYPRPPRGGRLARRLFPVLSRFISIHALREEGDVFVWL